MFRQSSFADHPFQNGNQQKYQGLFNLGNTPTGMETRGLPFIAMPLFTALLVFQGVQTAVVHLHFYQWIGFLISILDTVAPGRLRIRSF